MPDPIVDPPPPPTPPVACIPAPDPGYTPALAAYNEPLELTGS